MIKMTFLQFRKNFIILHCIKNIKIFWQKVNEKCMQEIWKKCLKKVVDTFEGSDRDENLENN